MPFTRRAANGISLPTWLTVHGPILLKRNNRVSKYDPLVGEVEPVSCNPQYAHIVRPDGKHDTVSLRRLAPKGNDMISDTELEPIHIAEQGELHATPSVHRDRSETELLPINDASSSHSSADPGNHLDILIRKQRTHPYNLRNS
ncbi:hypothetical protein CLF_100049, partial [Clonorchis sinensis]